MNRPKLFLLAAAVLCSVLVAPQFAEAKITHTLLPDIALTEAAQDITFSRDGSTAYILTQKAILLYSVAEARVTDRIPLSKPYAAMALSPDESTFYLTAADAPKIGVIKYAKIYNLPIGKSPIIGNEKAPVTITAFLDFQCPYCAKAYPLLQALLKKYPQDVKLVIKHFPLAMHKFGEKASAAALAAARQNKYKKVTELLFKNYSKLSDETLRTCAKEAGLDLQKFDKDMKSPEVMQILLQDKQAGNNARLRGVPAIFINGIKPKGRSLKVFSLIIENQLKDKK